MLYRCHRRRPRELARYIRRRYCLGFPATTCELLALCEERGIIVVRLFDIDRAGYCLLLPEPVILLRWNATPQVFAHELFHVLSNDEIGAVYGYSEGTLETEEEEANLFAALLCGD